MNIDLFGVLGLGILGLLVGSFTNVLIWRLPRGENIAFPPSHCPNCNHQLHAIDLVPLFSWLALGGKCRYCKAPINPRYPIVEAISGLAYAIIALCFPVSVAGIATLGLCFFFTILLAASVIDLETYTIPDELTLSGVGLGVLFALAAGLSMPTLAGNMNLLPTALPNWTEAVRGAVLGAGLLMGIDLFGSWLLRRFREREYPATPIDYQQISLGMVLGGLAGMLGQPWWVAALAGLAGAALSGLANWSAKKAVRVPEWLTLGVSLLVSVLGASHGLAALGAAGVGLLSGTGAASLLAGVYWWLRAGDIDDDAPSDASAMGFGDVKLAAVIGAFLGFGGAGLSLVVAIFASALLGLIQKLISGESRVKFGPYLALGAVVVLLWGNRLLDMYHAYVQHLGVAAGG